LSAPTDLVADEDVLDAGGRHHLRLAELGADDAGGASSELPVRDARLSFAKTQSGG